MEAKILEQELQLGHQGAELEKLRNESEALKTMSYAVSDRRHADAGQENYTELHGRARATTACS